jgi:hypothetical protein
MVPAGVPRSAGPVRRGLPKEGGGRKRAGRGCDALGGGQRERGRRAKPKAGDLRAGPADHAGAGSDSKIPSARCRGSALAVTSTADITIVRGVGETVRLTSSCRPERRECAPAKGLLPVTQRERDPVGAAIPPCRFGVAYGCQVNPSKVEWPGLTFCVHRPFRGTGRRSGPCCWQDVQGAGDLDDKRRRN